MLSLTPELVPASKKSTAGTGPGEEGSIPSPKTRPAASAAAGWTPLPADTPKATVPEFEPSTANMLRMINAFMRGAHEHLKSSHKFQGEMSAALQRASGEMTGLRVAIPRPDDKEKQALAELAAIGLPRLKTIMMLIGQFPDVVEAKLDEERVRTVSKSLADKFFNEAYAGIFEYMERRCEILEDVLKTETCRGFAPIQDNVMSQAFGEHGLRAFARMFAPD